jgi:hypothetical protein
MGQSGRKQNITNTQNFLLLSTSYGAHTAPKLMQNSSKCLIGQVVPCKDVLWIAKSEFRIQNHYDAIFLFKSLV